MPAVSGRQYRAMQAAAHGHSTLGIPRTVGQEYVKETGKGKAYRKAVGRQLLRQRKA